MAKNIYVPEAGRVIAFKDTASDADIQTYLDAKYPQQKLAPAPAAPAAPPESPGLWEAAGLGYLSRLQTAAGGAAEGIEGLLGDGGWADYFYDKAQKNLDEANKYQGSRITGADTYGEMATGIGEAAVQSAPDLAAGLAGAYAGGVAGASAGSVVPGLGTVAGGLVGSIIGGGIAAYPSLFGSNIQEQAEEQGVSLKDTNAGTAAAAAAAQAPLEALADRIMLGRLIPEGKVGALIVRAAESTVGKMAKAGATEGVTETLQQAIQIGQANPEKLFDLPPEVQQELADAAIVGLGLGAGVRGAVMPFERGAEARRQEPFKQLNTDINAEAADGVEAAKRAEIERGFSQLAEKNVVGDVEVTTLDVALDPAQPENKRPVYRLSSKGQEVADFSSREMAQAAIDLYKARTNANIQITVDKTDAFFQSKPTSTNLGAAFSDPGSRLGQRMAKREEGANVPFKGGLSGTIKVGPKADQAVAIGDRFMKPEEIKSQYETLAPQQNERKDILRNPERLEANSMKAGIDPTDLKETLKDAIKETDPTLKGLKGPYNDIASRVPQNTAVDNPFSMGDVYKKGGTSEIELVESPPPNVFPKAKGVPFEKLSKLSPTRNLPPVTPDQIAELGRIEKSYDAPNQPGTLRAKAPDAFGFKRPGEEIVKPEWKGERQNFPRQPSTAPLQSSGETKIAGTPKPTDSKTYKEYVKQYEARKKVLIDNLKARLKGLGTADFDINLVSYISGDGVPDPMDGRVVYGNRRFNGSKVVIDLAMDIYDPSLTVDQLVKKITGVLNHEVIHGMLDAGLITQREMDMLVRAARQNRPGKKYSYFNRAYQTYKDVLGDDIKAIEEEAVAEMFREWAVDPKAAQKEVRGLLNRILQFFRRLFSGFKAASQHEVFKRIESGEIGARAREFDETRKSGAFSISPPYDPKTSDAQWVTAGAPPPGVSSVNITGGSPFRISQRRPTTKKNIGKSLAENLIVNADAMRVNSKQFSHNVNVLRSYPDFPVVEGETDEETLARFKEHVVENLLWLHDQMSPEVRRRAKRWYDGARKITDRLAAQYNLPDTVIAATMAGLSPQKDWFQNVSLAERTLYVVKTQQDFVFNDDMMRTALSRPALAKYRGILEEMNGKKYSELEDHFNGLLARKHNLILAGEVSRQEMQDLIDSGKKFAKAMFVRVWDETYAPREYNIITPEGDKGAIATTGSGVPQKVAWGSFTETGKAISAIEDGSKETIDAVLGNKHKIRNFYNNIISPNSKDGSVTIDTHAVAAALLRPLAGGSTEVHHNFGTSVKSMRVKVKNDSNTGVMGLYAFYADAYREAAARRGILAREMQSITWEAVRGLYKATFKAQAKNVGAIEDIWKRYKDGDANVDETRSRLLEYADPGAAGINNPFWKNEPDPSVDDSSGDAANARNVGGDGVRGPAGGTGSRTVGGDAGRSDGTGGVKLSVAAAQEVERRGKFALSPAVGTPEFRSWFDGSKVVTRSGKPMVLYHGAPKFSGDEFRSDVAKVNRSGNVAGFYFTPTARRASEYTEDWRNPGLSEGAVVIPVFLSLKNPFIRGKSRPTEQMASLYREELIKSNGHISETSDWFQRQVDDMYRRGDISSTALNGNGDAMQRVYRAGGFDGVISSDEYVAFDAQQVKSVFNKFEPGTATSRKFSLSPRLREEIEVNAEFAVIYADDSGGLEYSKDAYLSNLVDTIISEKIPFANMDEIYREFDRAVDRLSGKKGSSKFSIAPPVNSPDWKEWWKNSKAVNGDGSPSIYYHGTPFSFKQFAKGRSGSIAGEEGPFFFTRSPLFAEDYSLRRNHAGGDRGEVSEGGRTIPVYLSVQNPFDYANPADVSAVVAKLREMHDQGRYPITDGGSAEVLNNRLETLGYDLEDGDWPTIEKESVQRAIRELGYDGFFVKENKQRNLAVYNPEQIKSVFNTFPEGEAKSKKFSLSPHLPEMESTPYVESKRDAYFAPAEIKEPAFTRALRYFFGDGYTRYTDLADGSKLSNLPTAIRVQMVDTTARVKQYERKRNKDTTGTDDRFNAQYSAWVSLQMAQRSSHVAAASLRKGAPVIKMQNGDINSAYVDVPDGDNDNIVNVIKLLSEGVGPGGEKMSLMNIFRDYSLALRGSRLEADGKQTPFDPQWIREALAAGRAQPNVIRAHEMYQRYNKGLMKAARDAGVISDAEYATYTGPGDYYGFYREIGYDTETPRNGQKVAGKIKVLPYKGSQLGSMINDPMVVMIHNINFWTGAIMRNIAAQKTYNLLESMGEARILPPGAQPDPTLGEDPEIMYFRKDGVTKPFAVKDYLLAKALGSDESLNAPGWLKLLGMPANILRETVTRDPRFVVANLIRDTMSTWILRGESITPFVSAMKGMKGAYSESATYKRLDSFGVVGGYDEASLSPDDMSARLKQRAMGEKILKIQNPKDTARAVWHLLGKLSDASDAASRIPVYDAVLAETGDEYEAAFRALEVMNFSRHGASTTLRYLTKLIPFLNARIQGFDVLYQGLKTAGLTAVGREGLSQQDARLGRRLMVRGLMLAAIAMALEQSLSDDEDYQELPEYIKTGNLLIPLAPIGMEGKYIAWSKPFEAGFLFATIPQHVVRHWNGNGDFRQDAKVFTEQFASTFGLNPLPQAFVPIAENAFNYDMFTGMPLISAGDQRLDPSLRYNSDTSKISRMLGDIPITYNTVTGRWEGISPIMIDNLITGYGGPMATYMLAGTDALLNSLSVGPDQLPSRSALEIPGLKQFLVDSSAKTPKSVKDAYELFGMVDEVNRTFSRLRASGDAEAAMAYAKENLPILQRKRYIMKMVDVLNKLKAQERAIERNNTMSTEEKRAAMNKITDLKRQVTSQVQRLNEELR